jgi:hypothetical protein
LTYFYTLSEAIRILPHSDCSHVEDCTTISVCDVEINGSLGSSLFHISSCLLLYMYIETLPSMPLLHIYCIFYKNNEEIHLQNSTIINNTYPILKSFWSLCLLLSISYIWEEHGWTWNITLFEVPHMVPRMCKISGHCASIVTCLEVVWQCIFAIGSTSWKDFIKCVEIKLPFSL